MFVQFNPKETRCVYKMINRVNPNTSIKETISTFTTKAGLKCREVISHYGENADFKQTIVCDSRNAPQMVLHTMINGEIRRFMRASEFGKTAVELQQIPYKCNGQDFSLISDTVFSSFCKIG